MTVRKGTYILVITLRSPRLVKVGALGEHLFDPGTYVYTGSAMGGLDQRVSRHLRKEKNIRWHIDNLTTVCDCCEAYESYPDFVPECTLARTAVECGAVPEMKGFGCSDCDCETHPFRAGSDTVSKLVAKASLAPFTDKRRRASVQ